MRQISYGCAGTIVLRRHDAFDLANRRDKRGNPSIRRAAAISAGYLKPGLDHAQLRDDRPVSYNGVDIDTRAGYNSPCRAGCTSSLINAIADGRVVGRNPSVCWPDGKVS
jgi:hypothetical protein